MRVVFDANVLARAHQLSAGPARQALLRVVTGSHVLVLSSYVVQEVERVLAYPRLLKRSRLTQTDIVHYLEFLVEVADLVPPAVIPSGVIRDVNDEPILGTALAGRADFICTRDEDFFDEAVIRFSAGAGVRILTDLGLLALLRT